MAIDDTAFFNAGVTVLLLVVAPFWTIYALVLLFSRGRTRAFVSLFGLTVLSSCVSWLASSGFAQEETPEHAIISSWAHRPRLWLTMLLSGLVILAIVLPVRKWIENSKPAAFKRAFVALPVLAAYVAYVWTMIDYYGFGALFRP